MSTNNTADNNHINNDEIRRRKWILNSIPYMTKRQARDLWSNALTDVEKDSPDIVYKLLQYNNVHHIFGRCGYHWSSSTPWSPDRYYDDEEEINDLPTKFRNDTQAFIAFTKQDGLRIRMDVPEQFRDNFDAMKAICSVCPDSLEQASDRLKDNEDVVYIACFSKCRWTERSAIKFASDRLQTSKEFIGKCFSKLSDRFQEKDYKETRLSSHFGWIRDCNGFWKDWSQRIAPGIINHYSIEESGTPGSFSAEDMSEFLRVLPPNEAADAAIHYPDIFFENEEVVLELIKRLEPTDAEKVYRSFSYRPKSKKLQFRKIVKAMVDPEILKTVDRETKFEDEAAVGDIIDQISSKKITTFHDVPQTLRICPVVLSKAVECGWFDAGLESFLSYTAAVKEAPGLWEERYEKWDRWDCKLYSILPEHLKKNEEVAIVLLELGCYEFDEMVQNIPSLYNSKRAMMAMAEAAVESYNNNGSYDEEDFSNHLRRCSFSGDKDLMVLGCNCYGNIEVVDKTLFEDRDFMERVKYPDAITKSSEEFQMSNLDLVEKAMDKVYDLSMCMDWWLEHISPKVWTNHSVVIALLRVQQKNDDDRSMLKFLHDIDEAHPLLNDKEVVSLSVSKRPSDLKYANEDLQNDKKFTLKCVRDSGVSESDRILQHISIKIRFDTDIIIAAIAKSDGNVVDCWKVLKYDTDEAYLSAILSQMRRSLQLHDMFMKVFLLGVSKDDQHTVHPDLRSPLPMLQQGAETSVKLKKMIASYAGVPIGQSYIETKGAIAALERFGISDQTRMPDRFAQMIRDM